MKHKFKKSITVTEIPATETKCANITIDLGTTGNPIYTGDCLSFCIAETIPFENPPLPIELEINGVIFDLLSPATNPVLSDQVNNRIRYTVLLGTETPSARMLTCLPHSAVIPPVIVVPIVTTPTKAGDK